MRKKLSLAIALAMTSGAAMADCTFTNQTVWDQGSTSSCTGKITITTSQAGGFTPIQGHGLYANNANWNLSNVEIEIKTTGRQADAIRTNGGSNLTLGDNLVVNTTGISSDAINVTKESSATLTIGNNAKFTTTASSFMGIWEGAHAVRANNSNNGGKNTISLGNNAEILTKGNDSWGIIAGLGVEEMAKADVVNRGSSEIHIGENATVTTQGTKAYGVFANTSKSSIFLGNNITVNTAKANSTAIYATNSGQISLLGSTAVNVMSGVNAIHAGRGASISSADYAAATSAGSSSVFAIDGMIVADKSKIKDSTDNGAYLSLDDRGGSVQLRMGGNSTVTRNDWAIGQSKFVIQSSNSAVDVAEAGVNAADAFVGIKAFDDTAITGDVGAFDAGQVVLELNDRSVLTGAAIGNGDIQITLNGPDAIWHVTQSGIVSNLSGVDHGSSVKNLHLSNGAHVFLGANNNVVSDENDRVQLDVETLSGSGTFVIRPYVSGIGATAENLGDLLNITQTTSGSHNVYIPSAALGLGGISVDGDEVLKVVHSADGNGSFALTDGLPVDIGHLTYTLSQEDGQHWYLVAHTEEPKRPEPKPNPDPQPQPEPEPPPLTNPADVTANFLNVNYLLTYVDTQTLLQRMGDLRDSREGDVWVRVFGGKLKSFDDALLKGFDMSYSGMQFGADRKIEIGDREFFVGGVLGYTKADPEHRYGDSDAESYHAGIYATYGTQDNFYVDALIKYVRMENEFEVRDSQGALVRGDGKSNGWGISLETGKRFYFNEERSGLYLEPQAQVSHSQQGSLDITSSNGLRTHMDAYDSTLLRASALIGYSAMSGDTPFNVYFKTGYVHELDGKVDIHYNQSAVEQYRFNRGWWDNGVGVTAEFKDRHNIYFEASYAAGNKFDKTQLNLGYRYTF